MNPTYILADSEVNKDIDPLHLHVVGCRSRLLETTNGTKYGIGRTNIGAISINLPNLAMDTLKEELFLNELEIIMEISLKILIKNQNILKDNNLKYSPILVNNNLLYPFDNNINSILDEASLAIGFIGGQELSDILFPNVSIEEKHIFINKILGYMSSICKKLSIKYKKIVTLIGVSGEGISYYFPQNDKEKENSIRFDNILKKGFYTNSFHIPVFEKVNPIPSPVYLL